MKRIILFLFLLAFNVAPIQAKTYLALGINKVRINLVNNDNKMILDEGELTQPGLKLVYGYEDVLAFNFQIEGSPKSYALFGIGAGYRPLHKFNTRFQPMLYGVIGVGASEDGRTEAEIEKDPKVFYYCSPELSLDYFIYGRTSLGVYINNPIVFNTENATLVSENYSGQLKNSSHIGLILKVFL